MRFFAEIREKINTATKAGLDAAKMFPKMVKTAEPTKELIGNKIADKSVNISDAKLSDVEEIFL